MPSLPTFSRDPLPCSGAAMNAGHLQLAALFVVQVKIGFHAAECAGNVVHNLIDQFIEIEDGGNLPRPFLQLEQMFDLIELHRADGDRVRDDTLAGM